MFYTRPGAAACKPALLVLTSPVVYTVRLEVISDSLTAPRRSLCKAYADVRDARNSVDPLSVLANFAVLEWNPRSTGYGVKAELFCHCSGLLQNLRQTSKPPRLGA